jgi:hypothetical protein
MRWAGIEEEVDIYATNLTNKTKCMSTRAKKLKKNVKTCSNITSAICAVKPEYSRLKLYGNQWRISLTSIWRGPKRQEEPNIVV